MSRERDDECLFVTRYDSKPHVLCWPMKCRTKVDYITHSPAVFVFFGRAVLKMSFMKKILIKIWEFLDDDDTIIYGTYGFLLLISLAFLVFVVVRSL